jgi:hypothetical protein
MDGDGQEEVLTTDEDILNSIGEGDESDTGENTGEEGTGEAKDTPEATPPTNDKQGANEGSDGEPARQVAGPQDLVDKNGQVIATGGKERRFYETAQREKVRADNATKELETAKGQITAYENAGSVGTQYNLTADEVVTGAQLIAAYKENPVDAIKYMLTQAQANGHNVDTIISGGTDMTAMKQMVDNALAPILGQQKQEADTQAITAQATEMYNSFMGQHPDAAVHEDTISRLLQEQPSLTLEAAYYKLQSYYNGRGLDWTKSLGTLQQEAQAKPPVINTQPQPPEGGGIANNNVTNTANVADVNTSTDDIIKQAMMDAGVS